MKKDFFEIMKNYNPEIKSFSVSSENIKEKAMQKIGKSEEKKKFDFRRVFTSIPAIVAVGLMVGTGVIAYELSTLDRAVQFYEEHPHASQTINKNDKEVINNLLKEETTIIESNGATIELTGSIYDENTMLLFFKLTAPENIVLDRDRYEFADCMFTVESESDGGAGGAIFFRDTDKTDNITYFTYEINCHNFKAEDFTDIHFENLCNVNYDEDSFANDIVIEGEWLIPLNLSTPSNILYLLDEPINLYNSERHLRIDDIKMSSLSLMIAGNNCLDNVDISVIMKDDSIINSSIVNEQLDNEGEIDENIYRAVYSFRKPIDLSEVKSIKLNDTEISVEDKYNEKFGNDTETTEPDTTGMTEIYAGSSYIPTTEIEDIVRLKSIKIDNENIAIALTSNAIQDTMTIITKDNQSELIPFGNGTDADGDGIYTEIHKLRNEYNPEDIVFIDIENAGVRLDIAEYVKEKYENITEATEPDTTGMTEIFKSSSNISATDNPIILKSIKIDDKNIAISLNTNNLDYAMTIKTKDQSEIIPFGNGTDADGDGIYTEIQQLRNEYNPEDIISIEIENSGLLLDVAGYLSEHQ